MLIALALAVVIPIPRASAPPPAAPPIIPLTLNVSPSPSPCRPYTLGTPAPEPVPTPTAAPVRCESWVAGTVPLIHTQSSPAAPLQGTPSFLGQLDGSWHFAKDTKLHVSGFDRTSGSFGSYLTAVWQMSLDPSFASDSYQCALCLSATGHQEAFATQSKLQPPLPAPPPQAQIFSTAIDLLNVAPSRFSADIALNADRDADTNLPSALLGTARGRTSSGTSFDDLYFVFQSALTEKVGDSDSKNRQWAFGLAGALTNHDPAPAMPGRADAIATVLYQPIATHFETLATTFQYGTHGTAQGQTINVVQSATRSRVDISKSQIWDLITAGSTSDYKAGGYYTARGANFLTSDGASTDALLGLHGFAGEAMLFPRSPLAKNGKQPMSFDASAWRFGDVHPRYGNLAATLTVPFEPRESAPDVDGSHYVHSTALVVKGSRGFVAASAASVNVAANPLTDNLGGAAPVPQSAFEIDGAIAGGRFTPDTATSETGSFVRTVWQIRAGYAVHTDAVCVLTATIPCGPVHHNQISLNSSIDGPTGFLSVVIGPATLVRATGGTTTNPDAATPHNFGDFINRNAWTAQGGVRLPTPGFRGICTTLVASASNTAPPPELTTALPGTTLNVGGFLEVVPLRSATPLAMFAGASHTIANLAQPAFGSTNTFGSRFSSTVTYTVKLSFGSEGYRNHLRRNCAWFASPFPSSAS